MTAPARRPLGAWLRAFASQLRRKLEPYPSRPVHLLTEPGIGYRLVR